MKHWKKRIAVTAAVGALAVSSLTGCSSLNNEGVVVTVGGENVSLGVANFYARMQQAQYETYYASMMGMTGEEMWEQEIEEGKDYEASVKESVMESLENLYLIRQHAEEFGVTLTDEEKTAIQEAAAAFDADNEKDDKKVVSGEQKYIEEYLELVTYSSKMDEKMREGADEDVSDEEAAQKSMQYVFFSYSNTAEDGSSEDMTDEEKEALKATAEQFEKDLKADKNKDIEALAETAGLDVQTLTFDSETTSPNEDLIAKADALEKEGDITELVEADNGLYIGKLTSLMDREATDAKKESIVQQRRQEKYDSNLQAWREAAEITVNAKNWKKVEFKNQGVTIIQTEEEESDTTEDSSAQDDASEDDTTEDNASENDTTEDDAAEE